MNRSSLSRARQPPPAFQSVSHPARMNLNVVLSPNRHQADTEGAKGLETELPAVTLQAIRNLCPESWQEYVSDKRLKTVEPPPQKKCLDEKRSAAPDLEKIGIFCQTTSVSAAHVLRTVLLTIPRIGCSQKPFLDGFYLHLLHQTWEAERFLASANPAQTSHHARAL